MRAIGKSIDFCMFKSSDRVYWINFVAQWGSSASWISGFSGLFVTTCGTLLMPSWSVAWSVLPGCLREWALTLDSQWGQGLCWQAGGRAQPHCNVHLVCSISVRQWHYRKARLAHTRTDYHFRSKCLVEHSSVLAMVSGTKSPNLKL